uniref:Uncharacterized protein n=1 Tax=viral metagenome TaxID=1070528 RepID=A0A6M3JKQ0_9ZZZZ
MALTNAVVEIFISMTIPEDFSTGSGYETITHRKDDRNTHLAELKSIIEAGCSELGYTVLILPTNRRTFNACGDIQAIVDYSGGE